jgi:hypothetical protein
VRTQQLLNQAQRIAYDIKQIDQALGRSYPQSYPAFRPRPEKELNTILARPLKLTIRKAKNRRKGFS